MLNACSSVVVFVHLSSSLGLCGRCASIPGKSGAFRRFLLLESRPPSAPACLSLSDDTAGRVYESCRLQNSNSSVIKSRIYGCMMQNSHQYTYVRNCPPAGTLLPMTSDHLTFSYHLLYGSNALHHFGTTRFNSWKIFDWGHFCLHFI